MKNNKRKWILIVLILFLILAAVILAVIFGMNKDDTGDSSGTTTATNTNSSTTTENSTKESSEAESKENTYYWLITDKKTGITVDTEGWSDAKDYNGISWAQAPTEELPYVWCYATDPDGKVVIEPTLWYEIQAKTENSTSTTTEVASSEKPSTEDTENKPGSNTNDTGTGNNGGSNNGNTGNNGSTPSTTEKPSSSGGNSEVVVPPTTQAPPTTQTPTTQAPATTQTPATTQAPSTTQAADVCPPHSYVYVVTEEKGHYEEVVVQEGYWKPVKIGSYNQCNGCGINLSNMSEESMTAHLLRCTGDGTSYHLEPIWGEEWVEPVKETRWIVDEQAKYYFQCSVCGKISSSKNPYN